VVLSPGLHFNLSLFSITRASDLRGDIPKEGSS
jgi:hypothetical protein